MFNRCVKFVVQIMGVVGLFCASSLAFATLVEETQNYKFEGKSYEAFIVYDNTHKEPVPGVLIVHDWMGLGPYSKRRARELAELGYVAMAADMYGVKTRPKNSTEAAKLSGALKSDRVQLRARANAALDFFKKHKALKKNELAAIGYCFGGTTVLEMARQGADLKAVVSFHGGLSADSKIRNAPIQSKLLVLHGADDPFVPPTEVESFIAEMKRAGADWQLVYYSGAVHSFSHPEAGLDNSKGAAYNESADKRSFKAMESFLKEVL